MPLSVLIRLLLVSLLLVSACEKQPVDQSLPIGVWRAALELPGGSAAFGLEIGRQGDVYLATLINGQERVPVPVVRYDIVTKAFTLGFPAYANHIDASYEDGRLVGSLSLVKREGIQTIPFSATPGGVGGSRDTAGSEFDASGRWAVKFVESDGQRYPAVGEFAQRGSRLSGTFLTPTGDYRYLGGETRGTGFSLSAFDGAHAFLFKAENLPDGSLIGEFWSGLNSYETFTAVRDPNARLPDANKLTFLNPGFKRFSFEFPNPGGAMISLDDSRFDGKVVVISLMGSWCPNCHDEATFLVALFEKLQAQGLEIVSLMFEHADDFETAATQVQRFREKLGIRFPTLIAGSSDKDEAAKVLPALNHVLAFPTTIFIDRRGNVRRIHTGFTGPGTGEHFANLSQDFSDYLDMLLAESAVEEVVVEAEQKPVINTDPDSPEESEPASDGNVPAASGEPETTN